MRTKRVITGVLLFQLFTVIVSDVALSQCMAESYTVRGQVVYSNRNPVENALILVFLDNEHLGCSGDTSETGHFEATNCLYETFRRTSLLKWHVCDKTPSSITIIVYVKHLLPKRVTVDVTQATLPDEERIFEVPPIEIPLIILPQQPE